MCHFGHFVQFFVFLTSTACRLLKIQLLLIDFYDEEIVNHARGHKEDGIADEHMEEELRKLTALAGAE